MVFFLIHFFLGLLWLEPLSWGIEKYKKRYGEEAYTEKVTKIVHGWGRRRVKEAGATVHVHGAEKIPERNVLFVSNHLSNLDFAVLLAEIDKPFGFIAKIELRKVPILNKWMDKIGCLFMDRKDMKQQLNIILEGIKMLKEGKSLLVFPEGTRSHDEKVHEFKAGSFKLATKSKVPIVPITIVGTSALFEANKMILKPGDVELYFHEPIYVENLDKEELGGLHKRVQEIISKPMENK